MAASGDASRAAARAPLVSTSRTESESEPPAAGQSSQPAVMGALGTATPDAATPVTGSAAERLWSDGGGEVHDPDFDVPAPSHADAAMATSSAEFDAGHPAAPEPAPEPEPTAVPPVTEVGPPPPPPIFEHRPAEPGLWGGTLPAPVTDGSNNSFQDCPVLEWLGGNIRVTDVSLDGSTLIGHADRFESEGASFRWRRGQPIEWQESNVSIAAVNADGTWLVGSADTEGGLVPIRVGPTGEIEVLADSGTARAISDDGTLVFGEAVVGDAAFTPFRWSAEGGLDALPKFVSEGDDGSPLDWSAYDVSGDGSVLLGAVHTPDAYSDGAVLWSEQGGFELLDDGGPAELSNDASVIIGCTDCGRVGNVAAAWSRGTTQPFSIGFPDSGVSPYRSYANGVSRDGSVILGDGLVTPPVGSTAPDSYDAYIWRKDHGAQRLIDLVSPSCDDALALQPDSTRNGVALSGDARLMAVCTQTNEESGCWLLSWP